MITMKIPQNQEQMKTHLKIIFTADQKQKIFLKRKRVYDSAVYP
ncbi:hypothetical protein HMPREF1141_2864 [Clostridium sp. MSTE9]|nr:hypothetical protein HMPREF1141_2864 [Clostridium sp. MSTE9]